MGKSKTRLPINIVANVVYIMLSIGMNFALVPYIVRKLGSEAYGFYSISNDFTTYAGIITIALNYMGCRFIAYSFHKSEMKEANKYFSSLFFGDVFLGIVLSIIALFIVGNIDKLLTMPTVLIDDIKYTFLFTFATFIFQVIMNAYTAGMYIKDRMDLYAIKNVVYVVLRALIIVFLYSFFSPRIYYVSLAALGGFFVSAIIDVVFTKKKVPEIKLSFRSYEKKYVGKLISAGGWYSFVSMGTVLSKGVDLVIANQMVDTYSMGLLAISKTAISAFNQLKTAIINVFQPRMIYIYATETLDEFVKSVKEYMLLIGFILYVPLAGLTAFSRTFYCLWLSTYASEQIDMINALTLWGIFTCVFTVIVGCLPELYAIINKLRIPTLVNFAQNIIAFILTLILLKITGGNIYIIVAISAIINMLYQFLFGIPYAAKLLNKQWWIFFPTAIKGLAAYGVLVVIFMVVDKLFVVKGWISFGVTALLCGCLGYCISFIILFNSAEKKKVFWIFRNNFRRKK